MIVKCGDCGEFTHPPQILCRHCQSENVAPTPVAGTGAVDTFTVNHQPWVKDLEVPFVIARVRLDGVPGVYLTTNVVNCPVEEVKFDDKVKRRLRAAGRHLLPPVREGRLTWRAKLTSPASASPKSACACRAIRCC